MFWSLILQPGKRYSSTVSDTFHLSTATLDAKTVSDNEICPVQLEIDGQQLILCNLTKSQFLQVSLDLVFERGTKVTFFTTGRAIIHLTGYLVGEDDDTTGSEEESDEESEMEEVSKSIKAKKSKGDLKSKNVEQQKNAKQQSPVKRKVDSAGGKVSKKVKPTEKEDSEDDIDDDDNESDLLDMDTLNSLGISDSDGDEDDEEDDDDDDDDEDDDDDDDDTLDEAEGSGNDDEDDEDEDDDDDDSDESDSGKSPKTPQKVKQSPKKQNEKSPNKNKTPVSSQKDAKPAKLNKSQTNGTTPKSEKKNKNEKTPQQQQGKTPNKESQATPKKKMTLEGGVIVEELKEGNGPLAKPGKLVSVYYVGRLHRNNRVFDQTNSGPAFKFRLGRSEVIKGWDVGLNGMKVGSKRRITCPANMAYGAKGQPPTIPPNSTLVFDVELKNVN